jgi:hypothetical protein
MSLLPILSQYSIPGTEIGIDLPSIGGWFTKGIFSAIGQGMYIFIVLMVVVWVVFSMYGAFSIISSLGDPQKIEKGWKTIKSVWIGISYFLMFFVVITLVATFVGMGAPWNWAENLQQCQDGGPAAGRFYFQGKFVPDPNDPQGFVRKSYSEQVSEYKELNPIMTKVYVLCCDDAGVESIGITGINFARAGCEVNSEKDL